MPKAAGPNVRAISIELTQLRTTEQVAVLNCQIPGRVTTAFPEIACGRCNNIFISSTPTRRFAINQSQPCSIFIQKSGQQVGLSLLNCCSEYTSLRRTQEYASTGYHRQLWSYSRAPANAPQYFI